MELLVRVARHGLAGKVDSVASQKGREAKGVRVQPVGAEQLRADSDDRRAHERMIGSRGRRGKRLA